MKIAFHFKITGNEIGNYALPIEEEIFLLCKNNPKINVSTKWFSGDLLLDQLASKTEETETGWIQKFDKELFHNILNIWLNADERLLRNIDNEKLQDALNKIIFVVGAESIDFQTIKTIHNKLHDLENYIGMIEVDETSVVHWQLYSNYLSPRYRQINDKFFIFWDGINEDSQDQGLIEYWKRKGFATVKYESLNGRYTLFDGLHNYHHAKRVAEFTKRSGYLLGHLVDDMVAKLQDSCPEIGSKFWSALKSLENAEINEEYAHVATTCRRIIEYVTDNIFPPTSDDHQGFKLGKSNYRNRLLAFADKERASKTNIDVIAVSTKMLAEQLEKLSQLQNKGVHDELNREEARRCLLRTIMILDDILSLKVSQFKTKTNWDAGWLHDNND